MARVYGATRDDEAEKEKSDEDWAEATDITTATTPAKRAA